MGRYFGKDVEHFISNTFKDADLTHYSEAIVITLPIILTALFLKGSVSRTKGILNFFPLIITSIVYAAFMLPVLPHDVQETIASVPIGNSLLDTSNVIIGTVVLIQLIALWVLNRGEGGSKRKRRKNKD